MNHSASRRHSEMAAFHGECQILFREWVVVLRYDTVDVLRLRWRTIGLWRTALSHLARVDTGQAN